MWDERGPGAKYNYNKIHVPWILGSILGFLGSENSAGMNLITESTKN